MDTIIEQATVDDAEEILALQKLAFRDEANLYSHSSIPPLTQTLEELTDAFKNKIFLKAVSNGKIIGSIRAYKEAATCYPEKLIVHPSFQNRGIGTSLMDKIEAHFSGKVDRFRISTVRKSTRNIRLYQKLGYTIFKTKDITDTVTFVYMEKCQTSDSRHQTPDLE